MYIVPLSDVEDGGVCDGGDHGKQQGVGRDVEIEIGETVGGNGHEGGQSARPDALAEHAVLLPPAPKGHAEKEQRHAHAEQKADDAGVRDEFHIVIVRMVEEKPRHGRLIAPPFFEK